MADHAIVADNLGKEFFLGENTARDRVRQALHAVTPRSLAPKIESLWAVRNVSFNIARGEAVGIIGHNGAGKSSLLKVLSRVTRPTEGTATIRGRVGTLLEVGTGFHPELTGRDNIFLSGSILGMTRSEVARKFDEIVAFSEIEQFLGTPVKRYSSGMYVRLAFAVAAFLDPEILIVDEVLAVGDSAFQRKSLGRLNTAATEQGRTVLFVSHNLQAIRNFCKRVLILEKGRLIFDGPTQEGIEQYLKSVSVSINLRNVKLKDRLNRTTGAVRFTETVCLNGQDKATWDIQSGDTARIRFNYEVMEDVPDMMFQLKLLDANSGATITTITEKTPKPLNKGAAGTIEVVLPEIPLRPFELSLYGWLGRIDGKFAYDVIDENVSLPYLKIFSDNATWGDRDGFINLPHRVSLLA
ncbi:MAG TPA: polysaccharide ABC transporter ATP-binding protein [Rhizomicrobium sp.]|nr:polysaccharide ABC transporter ATP-binding protein [Rhizomicrobium sp.]